MTTAEQADRNARNVLELVQARRQMAAVRALQKRWSAGPPRLLAQDVINDLDHAIARALSAPQALDPEEVSA